MSRTIRKKCDPEIFNLVLSGKKDFDLRLADFELQPGDLFVLEEFDAKAQSYTGRKIERLVKSVELVRQTDKRIIEQASQYGHYMIEMEPLSSSE